MATQTGNEKGYLLLQDTKWDRGKWGIHYRLVWVNSPSYDTRLYAYEPGVPSSFLLPAYFGKAWKTNLVVIYQGNREIQLALKWARINYTDRTEIGTSLDLIVGDQKTDITLQMIYKMH